MGCDSDAEPRPFGLSRYGAIPAHAGRGLPTALPAVYRLVPFEAAGVGFAVMSGIYPWDHSHGGQVGYLPDKEFRSSPPHVAIRLGPYLQLTRRCELAGVWPLRIPGTETASGCSSSPLSAR